MAMVLMAMKDRIAREDHFGMLHDDFRDVFNDEMSPVQWNWAIEEVMRRFIARHDPPPPDPVSVAFEETALHNPSQPLSEFAETHNISLRKLQRVVKRDFGLPPRTIMRRARALDLAAQLSNVANAEEEAEMILRYFDQSHLIRDFAAFFGVTPQKFRAQPRPLLTIGLEHRQVRKLEDRQNSQSDGSIPWRDHNSNK